jgi:hypothetical protein
MNKIHIVLPAAKITMSNIGYKTNGKKRSLLFQA